jgi:phosphoglycolate phosphatase
VTTRTAIFDLDGTLIDSKSGICGSVQFALQALGLPAPSQDELEWVIGPPMIESMRQLVGEARAEEAQRIYRARYAETGLYDNRVYDGIPDLLETLRAAGWTLYVATSKVRPFARKIIDHLGFDRFFVEVYGAGLDGALLHKDALLAHVVADAKIEPARAVMIGDRKHDVIGARANGVLTVGAGWGYGAPGELEQAGAAVLAGGPSDVPAALAVLVS